MAPLVPKVGLRVTLVKAGLLLSAGACVSGRFVLLPLRSSLYRLVCCCLQVLVFLGGSSCCLFGHRSTGHTTRNMLSCDLHFWSLKGHCFQFVTFL